MFKKTITSAIVAGGLCLAMAAPTLAGDTYSASIDGNFGNPTTWGNTRATASLGNPEFPNEGSDATIGGGLTVTVDETNANLNSAYEESWAGSDRFYGVTPGNNEFSDFQTMDDLIINGTLVQSGLTQADDVGFKVDERLTVNGTYDMQGGSITLKHRYGNDVNGLLKLSGDAVFLMREDEGTVSGFPELIIENALDIKAGGTLRIEGSAAQVLGAGSAGTILYQAEYSQAATAKLEIELQGGPGLASLDMNRDVALDGAMDLKFEGNVAKFGGTYTIANYGTNSTTFASTSFTADGGALDASAYLDGSVSYGSGTSDSVTQTLHTLLDGDTDVDGDVDNADAGALIGSFTGSAGSGKDWFDGDTDFDGDVDNADVGALIGAFGSSPAGNLTDTGTLANLCYDPVTGNLTIDAAEAQLSGTITSFQLESDAGFTDANYISATGGTFGGTFEDVSDSVLGDSDFTFIGFSGLFDMGNVAPTGLSLVGLEAFLTNAVYTGSAGSGQATFDLVLAHAVPEPTSLVLLGLGSLMMLRRRSR